VGPCLLAAGFGAGCSGGDGGGGFGPSLMEGWGNATVLGGGGVLHYAFTMDAALLGALPDTAAQERYMPADLVVSGQPQGPVGLRYSVPASALETCFDGSFVLCPKVGFKVKFDFVGPTGRFQGLKRLYFHAMAEDESQLRERLSAKLFADMKVAASHVAHAFISINGEYKGLFAVVEDIDEHFADERWGTGGTGNLYKDAWPTEVDADAYQPALLNNLAMPDHSRMIAFAAALKTTPPDQAPAVLDRYISLDYFMNYMAVNDAINDSNGVTTFYCDTAGRDCSNHNFFWYQSPTEEKLWLIPWETGEALQYHTPFEGVPPWNRPPPDCNQRMTIEGALVMPPGCDVIFRVAQAAGRSAYVAAIDRLLRVWDVGALHATIDAWAGEISDAVALDPVGPGPASWRTGVRALKRDVVAFRERLVALRSGTMVAPFGLEAEGKTDFEGLLPLPVMLGVSSDASPRSGAVHTLNNDAAIAGATDLRLDFELANETEKASESGFQQWVRWRVPMQATVSFGGFNKIRLRIKADSIRNARIDFDSPLYPDGDESPHYGWSVLVPKQATELVLEPGAIRLPDGSLTGAVSLPDILSQVNGLIISPEPRGRNDEGLFPAGKSDAGFLQIDDVIIE
jgi:hypothetical protein